MAGEDDEAVRHGYGDAAIYKKRHEASELASRQIDGVLLCCDDCLLGGIRACAGIRLMAGS